MQILMKHPTLGNEHVEEREQPAREAAGWVKWPRPKDEKAPVAAVAAPAAVPAIAKEPQKTRPELLAEARILEIKVDGRWSDNRLSEEIADAEDALNR